MLQIFLGENQSEKLKRNAAEMRELLKSSEVISIVPDQFSFAYDKALYKELGAKDFNRVTVLSFKRLSESFINRFGTAGGSLLSQNDRTVLLWLSLRRARAKKSLGLLAKSSEKPAFCEEMSSLVDSFRRCGISPQGLKEASEKLGGTLGEKLSDVAAIYSEYLGLLSERSFRDESSVISDGAAVAAKNSAFKGANVFVDRFDSFSPDELELLRAAIRDASSVTVNIAMPSKIRRTALSPFSHCEATVSAITQLAADLNRRVSYISCDVPKTDDACLKAAADCLFSPTEKAGPSDSVTALRADNLYDEADFVAAEIRRLVTREGYKFNDIAVITHDPESYSDILEASFLRYGVEAFIDRPAPAASMSLVLFMLDALSAAATRSPDTDKILKYLRSPFSPLSREEISALWDYCVRWNVSGKMWLEDFTASEKEDISAINAARQKAIAPLLELHSACESKSAAEISRAFCAFLKRIGAAERAYEVIKECSDEKLKLETARLFKQMWNAVMSAVTSVYITAGEEKMTLRGFGELLRLMLSQTKLASPPQKLDSVIVADVGRSVISEARAAFVVGLADGVFPADVRKNGLFSGRDIAALEEIGVCFDSSPEARLGSERFDCRKAMTAPTERLYVSYSCSDLRGKELRPSRLLRRICLFCRTDLKNVRSFDESFYCSTPESAYYRYAVSQSASFEQKAALREALLTVSGYPERLARLSAQKGSAHSLDPEISKKLFAPRDVNVTASRIDVYNRCGFEYFCRYGLKIEPVKPLEVDPANRGTVMHYLFESVLRHFGGGFSEASDDDIRQLIARLLAEFSEENLGGDFGKSAKFAADYNRLGDAAAEILLNMREEFRVSKFRPERFEYDLSKENGESVLSIPIGRGVNVNIRGIVDRVDVFTSPDGKRYVRVVDYKTGAKKFSFEDIYNGVNLQLLLYMLALTEGSDADFKDCSPAGILYMRAGFLECKDDFDPLDDEAKSRLKRVSEQLRRSGLIVENDESVEAMDMTFSGSYIPVKKKKDGGYTQNSETISPAGFKLLEEFAKRRTVEFGKNLLGGKIDAIPLGDDPEHLRCAYCDYSSVCDRKKYMMRILQKADGEKLKAEIGMKEAEKNV